MPDAYASGRPGIDLAHAIEPDPRRWRWVLARGLAGLAFGLIALLVPGPTLASLVLLFAIYMLVDGVAAIATGLRAARQHERWGWFILQGLANLAAAALAFFWPALTIFIFVWVVAAWAVLSGVFMLAAALRWRQERGRWWLVLGGLVSLLFGVLLFLSPVTGAIVMTIWLGAYAVMFGIALLLLALRLRREERRLHPAP